MSYDGVSLHPTCKLQSPLHQIFVNVEGAAQGTCGRGFVVANDVKNGRPLMLEKPLIVAHKNDAEPRAAHLEQWTAYANLLTHARREPAPAGAAEALAAFDDLGTDAEVDAELSASAARIASLQATLDLLCAYAPAAVEKPEAFVEAALMRVRANGFGFTNGISRTANGGEEIGKPTDAALQACAVYPYTSRINHSCAPSAQHMSKRSFCVMHQLAYDADADADVKMVVAIRDIRAGEPLSFNYGPEALLELDWRRRRAELQRHLGFVCGCARCVAEEAAETAGGGRAPAGATVAKVDASDGKPRGKLSAQSTSRATSATPTDAQQAACTAAEAVAPAAHTPFLMAAGIAVAGAALAIGLALSFRMRRP